MWKSGSRPAYSAIRMKLGEVIVSVTPRPGPEGLGQVGLARAEIAPQADDVARLARRGQGATEGGRRGRIGADQVAFVLVAAGIVSRA